MEEYRLQVVESREQIREFLDLPKKIYSGNRYWVYPLDDDIESVFDPQKNDLFNDGEAIRWLIRNSRSEVVGRLGAFYNREVAMLNEQPTGGCGFFESLNDQRIANLMFDAARQWLSERGMEAMDGPINFGDRDQWWGLLVEGHEQQPLYCTNYNPPYYKELFENYGFQNYFNQYTYLRNLRAGELSDAVYNKAERLANTAGYRFEHISKENLGQVADDFRRVYNRAWVNFHGVKPMEKAQTDRFIKTIKPIMDQRLIHFAYFNDEPIGFLVMVPDLNRILNPLKGKINWINALRLLFMLKFSKKNDRVIGVIFGVIPEFQGKGIESGLMYSLEKIIENNVRYKTLELMWIGDFNPLMIRVVENYVCAQRHKTHITYRYLFDRKKKFTRCPQLSFKRNI